MYKSFRDMKVWQRAMDLAVQIFELTSNLPRCEDYSLTSQIRRSSCSVYANIAEGFERATAADKSHFYTISKGSSSETQSHLEYGKRVKYFETKIVDHLVIEYQDVIHELNKIIKTLFITNAKTKAKAKLG
jgi:four helix bundle protein